MEITLATPEQIKRLTEISKAAFDSDASIGAPGVSGPPGYDSERWHAQMLQKRAIHAITVEGCLIGGLLVFRDPRFPGVMELGRIFIDPLFHRKGRGTEAIRKMELLFKDAKCWKLDTPIWNTRTKPFYEKLGYAVTRRSREFLFFQKNMM